MKIITCYYYLNAIGIYCNNNSVLPQIQRCILCQFSYITCNVLLLVPLSPSTHCFGFGWLVLGWKFGVYDLHHAAECWQLFNHKPYAHEMDLRPLPVLASGAIWHVCSGLYMVIVGRDWLTLRCFASQLEWSVESRPWLWWLRLL